MKRKGIFLVLIILVVFIAFITIFVRRNQAGEEISTIKIDISSFKLENRAKLSVNDELLIGENTKELENGYYDFKLANKDGTLVITLNKLWYEEYGVDYIQDEYLARICRGIVGCVEKISKDEELEYQLYKYIKDNYIKAKAGQNVESVELEKIKIWSKSDNNECIVYLKVE